MGFKNLYFINLFYILYSANMILTKELNGLGRLTCENPALANETVKRWMNHYNMWTSDIGFIKQVVHRSNIIIPGAEVGDIERFNKDTQVHQYTMKIHIRKIGTYYPFEMLTYTALWNLYAGDNAVFHTINNITKEYKRTELGSHSQQYFIVIPAYTWYAVEIEEHLFGKFIFVGITHIRGHSKESKFTVGKQEQLLQDFPEFSDKINHVYNYMKELT